jgi:hypothetical protein
VNDRGFISPRNVKNGDHLLFCKGGQVPEVTVELALGTSDHSDDFNMWEGKKVSKEGLAKANASDETNTESLQGVPLREVPGDLVPEDVGCGCLSRSSMKASAA